jgi:hypothetical protein
MRYVKNNFFDGDRQDSYDILTGAWVAKRGGIPPLTDTRPLVMRAVSLFPTTSSRWFPSFVMEGYRGEGAKKKQGKEEKPDDRCHMSSLLHLQ